MMNIRNLKLLSILIIVMVWCIPVFASVSHVNCTCCTQTKSCCEAASQNTLKIEKSESSCPQCRCNISQKSKSAEKLMVTSLTLKKNDNVNIYKSYTTKKIIFIETRVVLSSHTSHLKFTPLFIKNSAFLI
jgi:hypothetical protein